MFEVGIYSDTMSTFSQKLSENLKFEQSLKRAKKIVFNYVFDLSVKIDQNLQSVAFI